MPRLFKALGAVLCLIFALSFAARNASADTLTIGDGHELGFVNFGIPSGDSDRLTYVNHLIGMTPGTSDQADGQTYFRSNNAFAPLPTAVLGNLVDGTATTINFGSGGLYTYLFAKYDGPNYGSEVWDIGGLSGVTIPAEAGGFGLSGWTLFGPGSPTSAPEPSSLVLLGVGLVFAMRKRWSSGLQQAS